MYLIDSLSPVFLVLALGFALRSLGFVPVELVRGTNRLVYWVGLPCVLFGKIATARIDVSAHGDAVLALVAATALAIVAGYLAAWALAAPAPVAATAVQSAFRGNLAFVGLPVVVYSMGAGDATDAVTLGIVLLSVLVPVYNVAAVTVLLAGHHGLGPTAARRVVRELVTNPLVLAAGGGAAWALLGVPMPLFLSRTLESLGQMALPLALLGVGAGLEIEKIRGGGREPEPGAAGPPAPLRPWRARHGRSALLVAASLIKVGLGPAIGWILARSLGLSAIESRVSCVFLACPTAAASFVLADQLRGDRSLAAGTVALTTVLSLASLSAVLALV